MSETGIGVAIKRVEDLRFLTGNGHYTDDINQPDQSHAWILRSPHAHAKLNAVDTTKAESAPGVIAIFTGVDMAADGVGGLPCGWQIHNKDGSPMAEPGHPPLAVDKVRHVGDQIAIVIAETRDQARDAAELISVDYGILDAAINMDAALAGTTLVHDDVPNNRCFDWEIGDKDATDAAFGNADHVVSIDLANNRLIPNAMEPRAAISEFDRTTGRYTLYTTTQNPHVIRLLMGAFVLNIPEHKLRIVAPDVGGGFGSKIFHYAEEAILTWAAAKVHRPIKWTAERSESFVTDAHGRDHETHAELALDKDGKFLGLRRRDQGQCGALTSQPSARASRPISTRHFWRVCTRHRRFMPKCRPYSPTLSRWDAYRGAGRPECTYLLERLVSKAARDLGFDPVELRQKEHDSGRPVPLSDTGRAPVRLWGFPGDIRKRPKGIRL